MVQLTMEGNIAVFLAIAVAIIALFIAMIRNPRYIITVMFVDAGGTIIGTAEIIASNNDTLDTLIVPEGTVSAMTTQRKRLSLKEVL